MLIRTHKKGKNMLLTFIVPVYNTDTEKLERCISSIRQIHTDPFEIRVLIIDDGSEKKTADCCDRLTQTSDHILCIHQKNGGAGAARNTGIGAVPDGYIYFADADDEVIPEAFRSITPGDEDIIITDISADQGNTRELWKALDTKPGCIDKDTVLSRMTQNGRINGPVGKIIKSRFLTGRGICFDTDMTAGEDAVFLLRMLACNPSMTYVPVCTYRYFRSKDTAEMRLLKDPRRYIDSFGTYLDHLLDAIDTEHADRSGRMLADTFSMFTRYVFEIAGTARQNHMDAEVMEKLYDLFERVARLRPANMPLRTRIAFFLLKMKAWRLIALIRRIMA